MSIETVLVGWLIIGIAFLLGWAIAWGIAKNRLHQLEHALELLRRAQQQRGD